MPVQQQNMLSDDIKDYSFDLPPELIAQRPSQKREDAKLLVVQQNPKWGDGKYLDLKVSDLPQLLKEKKDLLESLWVRNRTKVFPARFYAHRPTGARHEIVLLEEISPKIWKALVRNVANFKHPQKLLIEHSGTKYEISSPAPNLIDFSNLGEDLFSWLQKVGEMPLPPYIKDRHREVDMDRYQSLWANSAQTKSAAAPTASLHFSEKLLSDLENIGLKWADIYLDVGLGTFAAMRQNLLSKHEMHAEKIEVDAFNREKIFKAQNRCAVGTTALRCLESLIEPGENPPAFLNVTENSNERLKASTQFFIKPGVEVKRAQFLWTNFHIPESTLLVLLCTFMKSREFVLDAYKHAISKKYRFFSYGDATLWLP